MLTGAGARQCSQRTEPPFSDDRLAAALEALGQLRCLDAPSMFANA